MIPTRQIFLKVFLDIMLNTKFIDQLNNLMGVTLPIRRAGHRQVVGTPYFVQVDKFVGMPDYLKAAFCVQRRLKADPCKNPGFVKCLERGYSVGGQGCAALPFEAKRFIETGERRGEGVSVGSKQIDIAQRTTAAFGERANSQAVLLQREQNVTSNPVIAGVIGVCGKTEHHLFSDAERLIFNSIFGELSHKIRARVGPSVEFWPGYAQDFRYVAIGAFVTASAIGISSQRRILAGLTTRSIDDRAVLNAGTVWVNNGLTGALLRLFVKIKINLGLHDMILSKIKYGLLHLAQLSRLHRYANKPVHDDFITKIKCAQFG